MVEPAVLAAELKLRRQWGEKKSDSRAKVFSRNGLAQSARDLSLEQMSFLTMRDLESPAEEASCPQTSVPQASFSLGPTSVRMVLTSLNRSPRLKGMQVLAQVIDFRASEFRRPAVLVV
jgi:hypothetical protein